MNYRRLFIPNSIVFITVVTFDRKEFLISNIELLKNAIKQTKEIYQKIGNIHHSTTLYKMGIIKKIGVILKINTISKN